ncbi:SPOSA6832_01034, partial [Sporobolomyces salmonicolor]
MSTTTQTLTEDTARLNLKGDSTPLRIAEHQPADKEKYRYARFLPHYTTSLKLPPLEPFEHVDIGHEALKDPNPRSFLNGASVSNITPSFGVEVKDGVDLTKLDRKQRAQLALYVAQKGVVVFRNQQAFIDADPRWQIDDWGTTFGRIHIHPVSGQPKDFPELHLVFRDAVATTDEYPDSDRLNNTTIHSDVTYELQPPGLTTLFLYETPESGGDTLFVDQREAYNRLSPSFRAYLETLRVVHSGFEQAQNATRVHGPETIKRQPVKHEHPLVRRHPVTGEKALFVQPGFSRSIVGLKKEESDTILNLLYDHIAKGHDFQARARWGEPGSVTLWDNRITAHSALIDWNSGIVGRRHGARITAQAERPFI